MAQKFDAAARLTEGLPAVDNVAAYVWACRTVGYQNADLTVHAAQVHDWYATEEGLDLRALDADCAAMQAAATAAQDALARHVDQAGVLAAVWQGRGAEASRGFLRRHGDAAAFATEAVSSAAGALADLRDALWHAVDAKVAAAQAIEDRVQVHRAEWLAAAQTVSTGVGDRAVASELIDQQIKPFVDNDIRSDWVSTMRAAMAAAMDAYDAATAELTSTPDAVFDVPQDLGPTWTPPAAADAAAAAPAANVPAPAASIPAAAVSVPAPAWGAPPAWSAPAPAPPPAPPAPAAVEPAAAPPTEAPAPTPAPPPSLGGGGIPDIGGGLSGLGQQLADTLGGLFGSSDDALDDLPDVDEPDESDEHIEELDGDEAAEEDDEEAAEEDETPDDEPIDPEPELECQPPEEELPAEPLTEPEPAAVEEPAPTAPPPEPIQPVPPPSPMSAETPCEIAADELPQVGE